MEWADLHPLEGKAVRATSCTGEVRVGVLRLERHHGISFARVEDDRLPLCELAECVFVGSRSADVIQMQGRRK